MRKIPLDLAKAADNNEIVKLLKNWKKYSLPVRVLLRICYASFSTPWTLWTPMDKSSP